MYIKPKGAIAKGKKVAKTLQILHHLNHSERFGLYNTKEHIKKTMDSYLEHKDIVAKMSKQELFNRILDINRIIHSTLQKHKNKLELDALIIKKIFQVYTIFITTLSAYDQIEANDFDLLNLHKQTTKAILESLVIIVLLSEKQQRQYQPDIYKAMATLVRILTEKMTNRPEEQYPWNSLSMLIKIAPYLEAPGDDNTAQAILTEILTAINNIIRNNLFINTDIMNAEQRILPLYLNCLSKIKNANMIQFQPNENIFTLLRFIGINWCASNNGSDDAVYSNIRGALSSSIENIYNLDNNDHDYINTCIDALDAILAFIDNATLQDKRRLEASLPLFATLAGNIASKTHDNNLHAKCLNVLQSIIRQTIKNSCDKDKVFILNYTDPLYINTMSSVAIGLNDLVKTVTTQEIFDEILTMLSKIYDEGEEIDADDLRGFIDNTVQKAMDRVDESEFKKTASMSQIIANLTQNLRPFNGMTKHQSTDGNELVMNTVAPFQAK